MARVYINNSRTGCFIQGSILKLKLGSQVTSKILVWFALYVGLLLHVTVIKFLYGKQRADDGQIG